MGETVPSSQRTEAPPCHVLGFSVTGMKCSHVGRSQASGDSVAPAGVSLCAAPTEGVNAPGRARQRKSGRNPAKWPSWAGFPTSRPRDVRVRGLHSARSQESLVGEMRRERARVSTNRMAQ